MTLKADAVSTKLLVRLDDTTEIPDFFVGQDWIDGLVKEDETDKDDSGFSIGDRLVIISSDDVFPIDSIVTIVKIDDQDSVMTYRVEGNDEGWGCICFMG